MQNIYLAGGCFWGLEELFRSHPGVADTEVGYTGGDNQNPTYQFHPGHAEAIRVSYHPNETTYQALLDFFFRIHDPTIFNRQGNDVGTSYRSAIFYEEEHQKEQAIEVIERVNQSGIYANKVVTTLEKLEAFWPAESEHQDFLQKNPGGYTCHFLRSSTPVI